MATAPVVEVFFFVGCPNYEGARELVERVSAELGAETDLRLVNVEPADDAQRLRFLGSPTIRVNGHDVEPGGRPHRLLVLMSRLSDGLRLPRPA